MIQLVPIIQDMLTQQRVIYHPSQPHSTYTPDDDVRCLISLARRTDGRILEMGCCKGVTTFNLAIRFPDRQVVAVDWTGEPTMNEQQFKEQPAVDEFCQFAGWLPNVVPINANLHEPIYPPLGKFGFIFIDADHRYEAVKQNTELALQLAERDALIAWHDYTIESRGPHAEWIGVNRLVEELCESGMNIKTCPGTMVAWTRVV